MIERTKFFNVMNYLSVLTLLVLLFFLPFVIIIISYNGFLCPWWYSSYLFSLPVHWPILRVSSVTLLEAHFEVLLCAASSSLRLFSCFRQPAGKGSSHSAARASSSGGRGGNSHRRCCWWGRRDEELRRPDQRRSWRASGSCNATIALCKVSEAADVLKGRLQSGLWWFWSVFINIGVDSSDGQQTGEQCTSCSCVNRRITLSVSFKAEVWGIDNDKGNKVERRKDSWWLQCWL